MLQLNTDLSEVRYHFSAATPTLCVLSQLTFLSVCQDCWQSVLQGPPRLSSSCWCTKATRLCLPCPLPTGHFSGLFMQLRTLRQKAGLLTAYNKRARSPPAPPPPARAPELGHKPPVPPAPMWALGRGGGEENGMFLLCRVTKSFVSDSGFSSLLPAPMQQEQASLLPSGRVKKN